MSGNNNPNKGKVTTYVTDIVTKYGMKKVMTTIFVILVTVGGTIGYFYAQNQTVINETIVTPGSKASDYVNGMKNWTVNQNEEKPNFMKGVEWKMNYIREVTVDDSKVDMSKPGKYNIVYHITAKASGLKNQNVTKRVTVKEVKKETPKQESPKEETKPQDNNSNNGSNNNNNTAVVKDTPSSTAPSQKEPNCYNKAIHHEEVGHNEQYVVQEAWDEIIPVYGETVVDICNYCGADVSGGMAASHAKDHVLRGEPGGHHTEVRIVQTGSQTVHHDAVYGTRYVVDTPAYDEVKEVCD